MDSITQAALGAAVAEAGLGRRLGNKAILWGAVIGTLPDLDILAYPFMDSLDRLAWHRGISHSLLLSVLAAPLLGWVMHRLAPRDCSFQRGTIVAFLIWFTHVLIDCFTVYGTQIFEPFSNQRVGFDNFFIIDPLYTLPLLIGLGVAAFSKRDSRIRSRANWIGLLVGSLYVLWSFGAKAVVEGRLEEHLEQEGIVWQRYKTSPTPFNTWVWRALVEGENGYWIGYFPVVDGEPPKLEFLPANQELLDPLRGSRVAERLIWFSEGYYLMEEAGDGALTFSDLRFGERPQADGSVRRFFSWRLQPNGEADGVDFAR